MRRKKIVIQSHFRTDDEFRKIYKISKREYARIEGVAEGICLISHSKHGRYRADYIRGLMSVIRGHSLRHKIKTVK